LTKGKEEQRNVASEPVQKTSVKGSSAVSDQGALGTQPTHQTTNSSQASGQHGPEPDSNQPGPSADTNSDSPSLSSAPIADVHPCLAKAYERHSETHADEKHACRIQTPAAVFSIISSRSTSIDDKNHQSIMVRLLNHTQGAGARNVSLGMSIATEAAGANPISGVVVGVFGAAVSLVIEIGKRFGQVSDSLKGIDNVLDLLSQTEEKPVKDKIDETICEAYKLILNFACSADTFLRSTDVTMRQVSKWAEETQGLSSKLEARMRKLGLQYTISAAQGVTDLKDAQYLDQMEKCKSALLKVQDGGHIILDSSVQDPAKSTCEWLLKQDDSAPVEWQKWRDENDSTILLVTGGIGTGKSVFAKRALKMLQRPNFVAVGVFHAYDNTHRSLSAILRGLLYQVAEQSPSVSDYITNRWKEELDKKHQPADLFAFSDRMQDFFKDSMNNCPSNVVLIVDGLDECDRTNWHPIIHFFQEFTSHKHTSSRKVLLVSRPEPEIVSRIDAQRTMELGEVQDKNKEIFFVVKSYVEDYIRDAQATSKREYLRTKIETLAEGSMLWVSLAVDNLPPDVENYSNDQLGKELEDLSKGGLEKTDNVYSAILRKKAENKSTWRIGATALRVLAGALKPLSVEDLAFAMVTVSNSDTHGLTSLTQLEQSANEAAIRALQPLVRISGPSSIVILHHAALKEFIDNVPQSHWGSGVDSVRETRTPQADKIHELICQICLEFLLLPLFREDDFTQKRTPYVVEMLRPVDFIYSAFYGYAAQFWGEHAGKAVVPASFVKKMILLTTSDSIQCRNWWLAYRRLGSRSNNFLPKRCDPCIAAGTFGLIKMAEALLPLPSFDQSLEEAKAMARFNFQIRFMEFLVQKNKASNSDLEDCFCSAVKDGEAEVVFRFLQEKEDEGSDDCFDTWKALLEAANRGFLEVFTRLLKRESSERVRRDGVDIVKHAMSSRPSLQYLTEDYTKRVEILKIFLEGKPGDVLVRLPSDGGPLLYHVAMWDCEETYDLLLQYCSPKEISFLFTGLSEDGGKDAASEEQELAYNQCYLYTALNCGKPSLPWKLLQHPALPSRQLSYQSSIKDTCLHLAVKKQPDSVVQALLSRIPRELFDSENIHENTPLSLVVLNSSDLEASKIARSLLKTGSVDVNHATRSGETTLYAAIFDGKIELCRTLILEGNANWSNVIKLPTNDGLPDIPIAKSDIWFEKRVSESIREELHKIVKEAMAKQSNVSSKA
jgi:hypothetical protein